MVSFPSTLLDKIIRDVENCDLDQPPNNKIRKVIFKPYCNLDLKQNNRINKNDPIPEGWNKGRKMNFIRPGYGKP